jgi:taurine transport system permease protein
VPSLLARVTLPAVAILALFAVWELSFRLSGLDPRIFSPPTAIAQTLIRLSTPTAAGGAPPIVGHLGSSLGNLALAMMLAITIGPLLGLLMGTSGALHAALAPFVNALLPIPPYAYIPIMLLWLGHGWRTIVTTTALAATLPLIYTTTAGVRAIDQRQVFALQSFGASRLQVFGRVVLPAAFAAIISGLRQSFGQAWRTLVGGEFIAAPASGLGYLIFNARDFLAVDVMFSGILVLSLLGFLSIYVLVGWIESRTLKRWGLLTEGAARK